MNHLIHKSKTIACLLVLLSLATSPASSYGLGRQFPVENFHMANNGMGWMMILFWGLVLGILIFIIRWITNLSAREKVFLNPSKSAMDILKERFAKGEIDILEYEIKKKAIMD